MTVLVTGGGGFLGGAIVDLLLQRGLHVRSFARGDYPALSALGVEVRRGDLADPEAVRDAVVGCEAVFHVAAKAGVWGRPSDYVATNVDGTRNVVAACRQAGVARLVYTSTPSVIHGGGDVEGVDESVPYPARWSAAYPETKARAERLVLAASDTALATVALRPHLIWGPGDNQLVPRLVERARQGRARLVGDGTKLVDSTFIANAAEAHLLAYDRLAPGSPVSGRAYFIAQGEPMPIADLINAMCDAAGAPAVTRSISPGLALMLGTVAERVYRAAGAWDGEPPITRFLAEQLATAHWYDLTAARRDLDYRPSVSFSEGVERLRAWYSGQVG